MNESERRLLQEASGLKVQVQALSESLDSFLTALIDLAESRAAQHVEERPR